MRRDPGRSSARRPVHSTLTAVFIAATWALSAVAGFPATNQAVTQGTLEASTEDGAVLALPLRHTDVQAEISGFVARVEVTQIFGNPFDRPIEAVYVFPLPDRAAVDDMLIEFQGRQIRGEIRRRNEARASYEKARREGRAAALLDQERPNVFTQRVANIVPGGEIRVHIRYVEPMPFERGAYRFLFPMVVGPRYTPAASAQPEPPSEANESPPPQGDQGADQPTAPVFTNPDYLLPDARSGQDIAITVTLDAGVPLRDLRSPSHTIEAERTGLSGAVVKLAAIDTIPNKDFVLDYEVAGAGPEVGFLAHREENDGYFLLALQPKADVSPSESAPKEIIFVVDVSGSMDGPPLEMSKRLMHYALERLGPRDTFNIVTFSERAWVYSHHALDTSTASLDAAGRFIDRLKSLEGTEMLQGFKRALGLPIDPDRVRIVVLLSDGLVSNEDEVLRIQRQLGGARLFTIGIGSSVNHYLASRLALVGRGAYAQVRPDGDGQKVIEKFYDRINRPYLTDLHIDWGTLPVVDVYPEILPDLFAGQPLMVLCRYSWGASDLVIVRGRLGGTPWEQQLQVVLPDNEVRHSALASVWARQRIDDLMMQANLEEDGTVHAKLAERVTRLALEHRLMSQYTSFVAVDDEVVNPSGALKTIGQPALRPDLSLYETVTVMAKERLVELTMEAQGQTSISGDEFQDLPVFGRNYQAVLGLAAGVQDSANDGNPNVYGSREQDFRMNVDGVANVDPLTGGYQSNGNPDSIEEIEIIDSGGDASFGGSIGGFGRIITKSGSNVHEGGLSVTLRDGLAAHDQQGGAESSGLRAVEPGIHFSGPLIRDRLWYVVDQDFSWTSDPVRVGAKDGFHQTGTERSSLAKVTWQVNPKNKLQLKYFDAPWWLSPVGVDAVTPPGAAYDVDAAARSYSLTWIAAYSPTLFWEVTAALARNQFDQTPHDRTSLNTCVPWRPTADGSPLAAAYCEDYSSGLRSGPFHRDDGETRARGMYSLTGEKFVERWLGGQHRIRAGLELAQAKLGRDLNQAAQLGVTALDSGEQAGVPPGAPAALALVGRTFPTMTSADADGRYYTAYITDAFEPSSSVTITCGLRFDREELAADGYDAIDPGAERSLFSTALSQCMAAGGDAASCTASASLLLAADPLDDPRLYPSCNLAPNPGRCATFAGGAGPGRLRTATSLSIANNNVAPRLSIAWDPLHDGKTRVSASWGRYYGESDVAPLLLEAGPDLTFQSMLLSGAGDVLAARYAESAFRIHQVDRGLRTPYSDESTIAVEREVAAETVLEARWIRRLQRDQLQRVDVNHRPVRWDELTAADHLQFPDCRQMGVFADCTGAVERRTEGDPGAAQFVALQIPDGLPDQRVIDPMFNEVLAVGNYNHSRWEAVILQLTRRYFRNWEFQASYTWSRSDSGADDLTTVLGGDPAIRQFAGGPWDSDRRHAIKASGRLFVPWLGGLRLGAAALFESGDPYSILTTRPVLDFTTDLAAGATGLPGGSAAPTTVQYTTVWTVFPTGGRNDQRNPWLKRIDVNVQKEFSTVGGRATVQLEILNLFNDDSRRIARVLRLPARGGTSSATDLPVVFYIPARQIQLTLKLQL